MLYFYQSISPHNIENLHSYLHFFFTQLFAEVNATYDHAHHVHPNFQNIINKYTTQIDNKLEAIFNAYAALNPAQKQTVKDAYTSNIDIENICSTAVTPVKYSQLPASIRTPIKNLYDNLWGDNKVLGLVHVVASCGTVKNHFDDFMRVNQKSVCPFCGINGLLSEYDIGKNDYDHYLKKSVYPFISVHFANIFPMCHDCNSKYKNQKDIPFDDAGAQRPVYFPLESNLNGHAISVRINSTTTDLSTPESWELDITCQPAANVLKKDAWADIFKIETRYKAKIAKESYRIKEWLMLDYKKKSYKPSFSFDEFKEEKICLFDDNTLFKESIIMKPLLEFVLNDPDFENDASENT